MDKTIIYYTSNREEEAFEQKIIDDMLSKSGNTPIISVSQKPMDLGQNICIGDVGHSYLNERKQILMAAKLAKTDYVIVAESDFLYSPEYFNFEPTGENFYRYEDIWIMWLTGKYKNFHHKRTISDGAQIVKRDYFVNLLEKYLEPYPNWYEKNDRERDPRHSPYHHVPYALIHGKIPCVSIKTNFGLTFLTAVDDRTSKSLPHWGNVEALRSKFL